MKTYLFLLISAMFTACNASQNEDEQADSTSESVSTTEQSFQKITMRDWAGMKVLGDTTISHSEFMKMLSERPDSVPPVPIIICDTIPLSDLKGNRVRDTVICSMMMPKK